MYDGIVVGGGPAGLAAAITIANHGFRCLLLERGRLPRHKVCGEFISPESLFILAELLGGERQSLLSSAPRIVSARLFLDGRVIESRFEAPAASLARYHLDYALWQAAETLGVDARSETLVEGIRGTGPYELRTSAGEFAGRTLIDASGRWSNLGGASAGGRALSRLLGVKAHFAESAPPDSVDLYFFKGGYCGVQPLRPEAGDGRRGRINACAVVEADVARSLPQVFRLHPRLEERSRSWERVSEPVATAPLLFKKPQPCREGIFVVGDAATFVDPFVGDGISLALQSGGLAARSLLRFLSGKSSLEDALALYRKSYQRRLAPVFSASSRLRQALCLPPWMRAPLVAAFERSPALGRYLLRKTRAR
jgi:flavin-dependent dehydrogenase